MPLKAHTPAEDEACWHTEKSIHRTDIHASSCTCETISVKIFLQSYERKFAYLQSVRRVGVKAEKNHGDPLTEAVRMYFYHNKIFFKTSNHILEEYRVSDTPPTTHTKHLYY